MADEDAEWATLKVEQWYGEGPREVAVATDTAVWYHAGKPPALLSINLDHTAEHILTWFVRRWTMEVTFEEARAHLGMETQRQWNDRAIARSTPALLRLFSIVTLTAHRLLEKGASTVRSTAWYVKTHALVRRHVWDHIHFSTSQQETDMIKVPRALFERFMDVMSYAA